MAIQQQTVSENVTISGIGLFSGKEIQMTFRPAEVDLGLQFIRMDLPNKPRIPVLLENVISKNRRTALSRDGAEVETIEHLLSCLAGLGISNLEIELDGPEVPHFDGSARYYAEIIQKAGIEEQEIEQQPYVLDQPISVSEGSTTLVALPTIPETMSISYTLSYPGSRSLESQYYNGKITAESYQQEIQSARTFCLQSEVDDLLGQGLGKGASYANMLVMGPEGPVSNELRYPDECVRHKVLDLIGDLYLLQRPVNAHIIAIRSGHTSNVKLARAIEKYFTDKATLSRTSTLLDLRELQKILPHRFPFLLIDKVIELDGWNRAVGIKNVTFNEPYFQGHFPENPIMPGVLQIEAMAQLAGALLMRKADNRDKLAVMIALDKVKLRKSVIPGDQLRIEAQALKVKHRTGQVETRCLVDGQLVSEAEMKFMLVSPE